MPQVQGTTIYTMTNAGAAVTWAIDDFMGQYILNGSATLAGSYTFAESGTPVGGMMYVVNYNAQMTLGGNNITIFGRQLTQVEALKKFQLIAIYDGSAFQTFILPDNSLTSRFYHGVTANTVLAAGGTVSLNPALAKGFQTFGSAVSPSLLAGYTVTSTGTPVEGDEFWCLWTGGVIANGQTVTIFGEVLSDSQVLNGGVLVHVVYSGSAWVVLEGATVPSSSIVSKSYAQLQTLVAASTLQINTVYFVNDRNIWIKAIESDKFELTGSFKMLCPDYQDVSGLFGGVWISTMGLPAIGDLYSYDNFMWENLTGAVGTAPTGDAVNWLCKGTYGSGTWKDWVNKSGSEYQEEICACEYDFTNDWVQLLHDKRRGNKIGCSYQAEQILSYGFNVIDKFQWGNNSVISNQSIEALINIVNTLGSIAGNELNQGAQIASNVLTATSGITFNKLGASAKITSNTLGANCYIIYNELLPSVELSNKTLSALADINGNLIGLDWTGTETVSSTILNKTFISGFSNMAVTLDLDTAIYAGTTLTIPTYYDYIGRFTLTSGLAKTITVIVNLPTNHVSRFEGVNGITYTFTSAAIGAAVAGNPVRTAGAGNDLVVGRTNGADFIEFNKSGTLCVVAHKAILT